MATSDLPTPGEEVSRRRWQFRLRTILIVIALCSVGFAVASHYLNRLPNEPLVPGDGNWNALVRYLEQRIQSGDAHAASSQAALAYLGNGAPGGMFAACGRFPVRTIDGCPAHVILFHEPAMSMPGSDFSMAYLVVDNKILDWVTCYTYNRGLSHSIQLEDIDDDQVWNLVLPATDGWWGRDDRMKQLTDDDDRWFVQGYGIHSRGFQPMLPISKTQGTVTTRVENTLPGATLSFKKCPQVVEEEGIYEIVVALKNDSPEPIEIGPGTWFDLEGLSCSMKYGPGGSKTSLRPGEQINRTLYLLVSHLNADDPNAELTLKYQPESERFQFPAAPAPPDGASGSSPSPTSETPIPPTASSPPAEKKAAADTEQPVSKRGKLPANIRTDKSDKLLEATTR